MLLTELVPHHLLLHQLNRFKFLDLLTLRVNDVLHLGDSVILPISVHVIVFLVLTHVTASHHSVLCDQFIFELLENAVILKAERLN